jgi:hypothetical protein
MYETYLPVDEEEFLVHLWKSWILVDEQRYLFFSIDEFRFLSGLERYFYIGIIRYFSTFGRGIYFFSSVKE